MAALIEVMQALGGEWAGEALRLATKATPCDKCQGAVIPANDGASPAEP